LTKIQVPVFDAVAFLFHVIIRPTLSLREFPNVFPCLLVTHEARDHS